MTEELAKTIITQAKTSGKREEAVDAEAAQEVLAEMNAEADYEYKELVDFLNSLPDDPDEITPEQRKELYSIYRSIGRKRLKKAAAERAELDQIKNTLNALIDEWNASKQKQKEQEETINQLIAIAENEQKKNKVYEQILQVYEQILHILLENSKLKPSVIDRIFELLGGRK